MEFNSLNCNLYKYLMEIKYICPYWGQTLAIDDFIQKSLSSGYDGVEIYIQNETNFLNELKNSSQLSKIPFVLQQYLPPTIESFGEYRRKFNELLWTIVDLNPEFINSHTGKDFFSFEENCILLEDAASIASASGIKIIHETHRGRFAFHLPLIIKYLQKYSWLKLNADLSHLCVVSESLLEDQSEILDLLLSNSEYIHARIASSQSPQVNNPFAPEWKDNLLTFTKWWQKIIDFQVNKSTDVFYICPEFGPEPYLATLPFTQIPLADQWDVNVKMMLYLKTALKYNK